MLWWEMVWGVAGVLLGCVTGLVIALIRASAGMAVKSWTNAGSTASGSAEPEQVRERAA